MRKFSKVQKRKDRRIADYESMVNTAGNNKNYSGYKRPGSNKK